MVVWGGSLCHFECPQQAERVWCSDQGVTQDNPPQGVIFPVLFLVFCPQCKSFLIGTQFRTWRPFSMKNRQYWVVRAPSKKVDRYPNQCLKRGLGKIWTLLGSSPNLFHKNTFHLKVFDNYFFLSQAASQDPASRLSIKPCDRAYEGAGFFQTTFLCPVLKWGYQRPWLRPQSWQLRNLLPNWGYELSSTHHKASWGHRQLHTELLPYTWITWSGRRCGKSPSSLQSGRPWKILNCSQKCRQSSGVAPDNFFSSRCAPLTFSGPVCSSGHHRWQAGRRSQGGAMHWFLLFSTVVPAVDFAVSVTTNCSSSVRCRCSGCQVSICRVRPDTSRLL